jgi:hypothetical protein
MQLQQLSEQEQVRIVVSLLIGGSFAAAVALVIGALVRKPAVVAGVVVATVLGGIAAYTYDVATEAPDGS